MTEKPQTIARLDRSQPPPGYHVDFYDGWWWSNQQNDDPFDGNEAPLASRDQAVTAAWAHYEREHEPPGLDTGRLAGVLNRDLGDPSYDPSIERWVWVGGGGAFSEGRAWPTSAEARAAAWAWYWRRVALAQRLGTGPFARLTCECSRPPKEWNGAGASLCQHSGELLRLLATEFWPRCLAWPDEQVAAVERWLAEGGELPEVLRNHEET